MVSCYWKVDRKKFRQFHELLCANNGRYLTNPSMGREVVWVNFTVEDKDTKQFWEQWNRVNILIVEVRSDSWWKYMFRRIFR